MSRRKYQGKGLKSYEREPLSREEIRELIQVPDNLRDRLIIALLYDTGLRTNELADLKLSDIDPEKEMIKVVGGKRGRDRLVPYSREKLGMVGMLVDFWLRKERGSYLDAGDDDHFFVSRHGKGLKPDEIRKIVRKAAEQAGIQKIHGVTPRILRHSFATHATGK